ncbi:MAG: ABC transporter ATP-binding protein [Hyphomicrobiaceae bacterium]|nr:MAG: ABC transporter ATP-binding protein [Hyphomicrobiaceae bacterium]
MSILAVDDIAVSFGGVRALDGVTFSVPAGIIFSIIGPNGAGKTTLFNVLTGLSLPTRGRVQLEGKDVTGAPPHRLAALGLSRTFQNLQIFPRMTALGNVRVGRHLKERTGTLRAMLRPRGTAAAESRSKRIALELLDRVGLAGVASRVAGGLPYGMMKRLEIARALASEPRLLLLDEPAAGCNPAETAEIDRLLLALKADGITLVLVEHDMKLVMGISDRVLVLVEGKVLVESEPAAVKRDERVAEAYLGTVEAGGAPPC